MNKIEKKYKIGYTTGVFDLFHIGHLNILRHAKELCDYLIVGVSTDQLVWEYKNKLPVIPFEERFEIIKSIRYVDYVVPQENMEKTKNIIKYSVNAVFVGDDWKNTDKWKFFEKEFKKLGVETVYLPHTEGVSSTILRYKIKNDGITK